MASQTFQPVAALNGRIVPVHEARLSIIDDGIVQGTTVTERVRTFGHQPYLLTDHLQRLNNSLRTTGIAPASVVDDLPQVVEQVVDQNAALIADWQDLSVVIFITPGINQQFASEHTQPHEPTVCVHTQMIPKPEWAGLAKSGVRLAIPAVRQPPASTLDPNIKHRSRLHWFLADQEGREIDPHAAALLLDEQASVTETATGNLVLFDGTRLLSPLPEQVLEGISLGVVTRLAAELEIELVRMRLTPADVLSAKEAFLTSTSYCLLPVTHLNLRSIGNGQPGPLTDRLLEQWSAEVNVDIRAQQLGGAQMEQV